MTKEDYLKLPKERLAELLAERDLLHVEHPQIQGFSCFTKDGICMNPFHDCINCPRQWGSGGTITTTNTNINK